MDRRERMKDLTLMLDSAFAGLQSNLWTALPAQYVGPGAEVGTANVQPTIQGRFLQQNGETWGPWVNLPVCPDCPISWPGGKRGRLVWPLVAGDEGLLVFSSRAIDNWWLQGGPQPSSMPGRMHDLSDGIFFPGIFSQPNKPAADTPPANMRLTSDDGLTYVELDDVGKIISVVAPGGIALVGPLTINGHVVDTSGGTIAFDAPISSTGEVTAGLGGADQVDLQGHTHSYLRPSAGGTTPTETASPTAGT